MTHKQAGTLTGSSPIVQAIRERGERRTTWPPQRVAILDNTSNLLFDKMVLNVYRMMQFINMLNTLVLK